MDRDRNADDLTESQELDTEFAVFEQQVARVSYAPPGPPLPRVGQRIAGKYRIDGLLGCGGMGAVFSVTHLGTGRPFAIKWLLPNLAGQPAAVQRFRREARASGKIVHPNVIQVYDIGEDGEAHFIVMELVRGETLADRLSQRGRFDVAETCRVLIPVMRGVHAAHLAGVVHRDIKPHNIMLSENFHGEAIPKVLDFGISKIIRSTDTLRSLSTRGGAIIGTPHYMSLEQLRSARVDARSDVYALGVVAYRMLSGTLPFTALNYADLVCQILGRTTAPLDQVPGIPSELARVIAKAMSIEPDDRFASVAAMARAFEPFAGGMSFAPRLDHTAVDEAAPTRLAERIDAGDDSEIGLQSVSTDAGPTPLAAARASDEVALHAGLAPLRAAHASIAPSARAARESLEPWPRAAGESLEPPSPARSWPMLVLGGLVSIALVTTLWLAASSFGIARTQSDDAAKSVLHNRVVERARAVEAQAPWGTSCRADAGAACAIAATAPEGWEAPSDAPPKAPDHETDASRSASPTAPRKANTGAIRDPKTRINRALLINPGDFR